MIKINIITNNKAWFRYIKSPNSFIDRKVRNLNKKSLKFKKNIVFCTLLLSGEKEIKKLNKKFRNKNKVTDVLSFPFYNPKEFKLKIKKNKEVYLGDIIINLNKIKSKNSKNNFKQEFNKLWIHGLTHLLGYDHKKNKDFYAMRKIENKLIKSIR